MITYGLHIEESSMSLSEVTLFAQLAGYDVREDVFRKWIRLLPHGNIMGGFQAATDGMTEGQRATVVVRLMEKANALSSNSFARMLVT